MPILNVPTGASSTTFISKEKLGDSSPAGSSSINTSSDKISKYSFSTKFAVKAYTKASTEVFSTVKFNVAFSPGFRTPSPSESLVSSFIWAFKIHSYI